jgi:hypothetical protein
MVVRKWITVDVHYAESEIKKANKERKRLKRLGYEYQQTDVSGRLGSDHCDQYIKIVERREL